MRCVTILQMDNTRLLSILSLFGTILLASILLVPSSVRASFQEWQVIDAKDRQAVPFQEWIRFLAQQDVIYLGEEHHNHRHIEAALKILSALVELHRRPLLGMEMFGWDAQAALTQRLADTTLKREPFLDAVHWQQNWGGAFEDYEPLVDFARINKLTLLALNPPRPLVRKVATEGLRKAMNDPDMATWGMARQQIVEDTRYREIILKQLQLCHGGLPEHAYERMYEASMFRDEGMAKTIRETLERISSDPSGTAGPIVSYTGGGHIQYGLPIPSRVRRDQTSVKQKTVYMTSFVSDHPEEVTSLLEDHIADYIWLTPVGNNGPTKRCR